ncbi:MAG: hypothetical protein ACYC9S_13425 [Leptospirales bacterium]
MKKKTLAAVTVFLIFAGVTASEMLSEPYHMKVFHYPFSKPSSQLVQKVQGGPTMLDTAIQLHYYNLTAFGNTLEMAIYLYPNMEGTQVVNLSNGTYYGPPILAAVFDVWIQNESLNFPYTSVTLAVDSVVIGANGTIFNNTPGCNGHTLDRYLSRAPWGYGGGTFGGGIESYWFSLNPSSNATRDINPGNYTLYVNTTVTPVVSIGPYHFSSSPFTARFTFIQDYTYEPWWPWS